MNIIIVIVISTSATLNKTNQMSSHWSENITSKPVLSNSLFNINILEIKINIITYKRWFDRVLWGV